MVPRIMSYAVNTLIIQAAKMKISKQIIWIFMTVSDNCWRTSGWLPVSFVWMEWRWINGRWQPDDTIRWHGHGRSRGRRRRHTCNITFVLFLLRLLLLMFDFDSNQKIKYLFFECFLFWNEFVITNIRKCYIIFFYSHFTWLSHIHKIQQRNRGCLKSSSSDPVMM